MQNSPLKLFITYIDRYIFFLAQIVNLKIKLFFNDFTEKRWWVCSVDVSNIYNDPLN